MLMTLWTSLKLVFNGDCDASNFTIYWITRLGDGMSTLTFTTRTKRHVVKSFDVTNPTVPVFLHSFGEFEVPGSDNGHLSFPWGVTRDLSNNVYVCDHDNHRVMKLNSSLVYVDSYDTELTIGNPSTIFLDVSGDLYVAGMSYHTVGDVLYAYLGIEQLTTSLVSVKFKRDIVGKEFRVNYNTIDDKLRFISRGFSANQILVGGVRNIVYSTLEVGGTFSDVTARVITGAI
jgi:hypothetical protein